MLCSVDCFSGVVIDWCLGLYLGYCAVVAGAWDSYGVTRV